MLQEFIVQLPGWRIVPGLAFTLVAPFPEIGQRGLLDIVFFHLRSLSTH